MPAADTARLIASLELDDRKFKAGTDRALGSINRIDRRLGAFSGAINRNLGRLVDVGLAKGVSFFFDQFQQGADSLRSGAVIAAQTAAVIKSTGGVAGVSAQHVSALADSLSELAGVDDDVVAGAENMLLTFTNIGAKGGVFDQATRTAIDMAAALGGDATQQAMQLGKALNDPVKGVGALSRVGVTFTEKQKKLIAGLVKQNKLQAAQRIILRELKREFGGVAQAQADADPGRRLNIAIGKAQEALAKGLLPVVENGQKKLTAFLKDPGTIKAIENLGTGIGKAADEALKFAQGIPWDKVGSGLEKAAGFAKTLIGAFTSLPAEAQATILALAGLNKLTGGAVTGVVGDIAGMVGKALGSGLKQIFAAQVTVVGPVTGPGGALPGALGAAGEAAAGGILGTVALSAATIGSLAAIIGAVGAVPVLTKGGAGSAREDAPIGTGSTQIEGMTARMFRGLVPSVDRLTQAVNNAAITPGPLAGPTAGKSVFRTVGPAAGPTAGRSEFDPIVKKVADLQAKLDQTLAQEGKATRNHSTEWLGKLQAKEDRIRAQIDAAKAAQVTATSGVESTARSGLASTTSAVDRSAATISGAIAANRPIVTTTVNVNVTAASVEKKTTTATRYGPTGSSATSRNKDRQDG